MILKALHYYGHKIYLLPSHGGTSDFYLEIPIEEHYLFYSIIKNDTEVVALNSLLTDPPINSVSIIDIIYIDDEKFSYEMDS